MQMQIPDKAGAQTDADAEAEAKTAVETAAQARAATKMSERLVKCSVCVCATWRMSNMHECQLHVSILSVMVYNSGTSCRHLVK